MEKGQIKVGDKFESLEDRKPCRYFGSIYTVTKVTNSGNLVYYVDEEGDEVATKNNPHSIKFLTKRKKRKSKLKNLKQFHELEEGNFYRLLHGGDVDHGYDYQLVKGVLRNVSKNRASSVPFNTSTRFLETTQSLFKFDSLDHDVVFQDGGIKVGCQNLSIKDAKEIAFQILDRY